MIITSDLASSRADRARRRRGHVGLRLGAAALVATAALSACESPPAADPSFWRPWYEPPAATPDPAPPDPAPPDPAQPDTAPPDPAQADPATPDPATPGPTTPPPPSTGCGLTVSVATASLGGTYAPNNIGAIWIAAGDRFVKSLEVWANRRREHLERWVSVTAAAGLANNRIDAISTATMTGHGTRTAAWNCTDASRHPVPDGEYRVCFELTESNGAGPLDCVTFTKGPLAATIAVPDLPTFKKRKLVFSP